VPSPFWSRWAATHAVCLHPDNSRLYEKRLQTKSALKNVKDGLLGHHLGMDLPLGGLGNHAPTGVHGPLFIGPAGVPYRKLSCNQDEHPRYLEEVQHGHLYLRWDDFGVTNVPVLAVEHGNGNSGRMGNRSRSGSGRKHFLSRRTSTSSTSSNLSNGGRVSTPGDGRVNTPTNSGPITPITPITPGGGPAEGQGVSCAQSRTLCGSSEEWMQLPTVRSIQDLEAVLLEHGYHDVAKSRDSLARLYRLLVEDSELALQSDGDGRLRLRGVVIHLIIRHQEDGGEEKVLVHLGAEAEADPTLQREEGWFQDTLDEMRRGIEDAEDGARDAVNMARNAVQGLQQSLTSLTLHWHSEQEGPPSQPQVARGSGATEETTAVAGTSAATAVQATGQELQPEAVSSMPSDGGYVDAVEPPTHVEDPRVPSMLRRRHESWTEALRRLCQSQFQLESMAAEELIRHCSRSMSGDLSVNPEDELCIYACDGPATLCHHHHGGYDIDIPVEYQAYRFTYRIGKKSRSHFERLLQATSTSVELSQCLDNFGGRMQGSRGTITRSWAWLSQAEAEERGVAGLSIPEERLHITHETEPLSAVLIGIENSAPHKESFFGKHGMNGASNDSSPFGSRKWRDYRRGGQEVPADIGGMRVSIDQKAFDDFVHLCNSALLSKPSQGYIDDAQARNEKQLFRDLLASSDEEAETVLRTQLQFGRPTQHYQTGTMVLDSVVRERSTMSPLTSRTSWLSATNRPTPSSADTDSDEESSRATTPASSFHTPGDAKKSDVTGQCGGEAPNDESHSDTVCI